MADGAAAETILTLKEVYELAYPCDSGHGFLWYRPERPFSGGGRDGFRRQSDTARVCQQRKRT
jgi:hypothetical protein